MRTVVEIVETLEARIDLSKFILVQIEKEFIQLEKSKQYMSSSQYEEIYSDLCLEKKEYSNQILRDEIDIVNLKENFKISESRNLKKGGQSW